MQDVCCQSQEDLDLGVNQTFRFQRGTAAASSRET